ncbi:FecR family protein [uncultured Polaribacter sp.]|uniref:FecR family protein n=1 Tax=uncultured Polaribacter sp. TaxID=174711 RepID=UPI00260CD9B7|nr:FecR family protein [uncultured Polaribacter sp.]
MKYIHYTVEDFVKDEYFQKWILDNDSMTSNFWDNWLAKHPEKKSTIEEAKELILLLDFDSNKLSETDFDAMWQNIVEKRNKKIGTLKRPRNKKGRRLYWAFTAAASILLLVSLTVFFNKENTSLQYTTEPIIVNNQIDTGSDKATLTLDDGTNVVLEKGKKYTASNVTSNGEEIVYKSNTSVAKKTASTKIAFNTLTIPRGGQFFMKLADGTQVWLNSESQLKYPVAFREGKTRQVELVYGEAYFDVSPSTENKGSKFKVFNAAQEIEVLGTEFNMKAYKNEKHIYTTLVEGKVAIATDTGRKFLKPKQQSKVNLFNKNITISKANIFNEVSWKDGIFSFNDKSLKEIMVILSRWYDMEVEFKNTDIENEEFIGVLKRTQDIEGVLSIIKSLGVIKNYEINNRKVILQ